ncbi:PAS domain-containing protein [Pseudomonas sp. MLB6B]
MDLFDKPPVDPHESDEPEPRAPSEAQECLQLALDAGAIIGTWVWSVPDDRLTADERFAEAFGLCPDRCAAGICVGEAFASIHPDDRNHVTALMNASMQRGGTFRCEYRVLRSDGQYHWTEGSGRAELDAQGRAVRFPGVLLDIEARRAAEAERDRVTAMLHTFTSAVPGVVYAKDRQGRMLVANHGTTLLIGKPPSFYLGKTDLEFLEDEGQARQIMQTDQRIMRQGRPEQVEERVNMPDGTEGIWLSNKAPLFDKQGVVVGLIGSSMDVTERKATEAALQELNRELETRVDQAVAEREAAQAALRQSQKMEAVGQLTGGIAHDFNNLLAGISGSLDLIKLRLGQGRLADAERYLSVAQGAAQRAAALTHRLLAFSRRQNLMPVPTDVNALIRGLEDLVRRTVGPSITVKVDLSASAVTCLVDPAQLENTLLNLCINARDALKGGGCMTISTFDQWLEAGPGLDPELAAGRYFTLCVADDGTGMSPQVLAKAFEPFFTTKAVGAGTGLGLSMIYGFAKQSGGQVRIESVEGEGTRVYLQLPSQAMAATPVAEIPPILPEAMAAQGETVLVVDDEPSVRMFVSELLVSHGYRVMEAADSQSGLQLLRSDVHIDLLVTDIGLPGTLDGRQMADAGRLCRPALPVLFMTGFAQPHVLEDRPLETAMAVLTKPFALERFFNGVNTLLGKSAEPDDAPG